MRLRDREVPVFRPVIVTTVLVYNYPFDGDDMEITSFFEKFWAVRSVHKQTWTSDSDIYTGTSVVKIVLNRLPVIRRNVSIDGVKVKLWYKDQPVECDLCLGAHRVAGCPLKGKRLRCRQEGHIARSCPNPPWSAVGVEDDFASDDPTPAEAAAQSSPPPPVPSPTSPPPPSPTPPPPPPTSPSVDLGESIDMRDNDLSASYEASQSLLADVSPVVSPIVSCVTSELGNESIETNCNLSSVSQAADNPVISSVGQAADNKLISIGSQAAANVTINNDSQAAGSNTSVSNGSQAAEDVTISNGSQVADSNISVSNGSQAAENVIVSNVSQAADKEIVVVYDSQAAISPSPSPVQPQMALSVSPVNVAIQMSEACSFRCRQFLKQC